MKNIIKFLMMIVVVISSSFCILSCESDDIDVTSGSIIGTWEMNGSTPTNYYRITFRSNGTGVEATEDGSLNFSYTYSFDVTKSKGDLKLWYNGSEYVYNYEITITGNTMMQSDGSTTYIFKKKN